MTALFLLAVVALLAYVPPPYSLALVLMLVAFCGPRALRAFRRFARL